MTKLTLVLEAAWAELLADAAREAKVSVNEYLRQMITRDAGVQTQVTQARRAGATIPPIGKTWGKATEDTEVISSNLSSSTIQVSVPETAKPLVRPSASKEYGWSKDRALGKKSSASKKPTRHEDEEF